MDNQFKRLLCLAALCTVAFGTKCYDCAYKDSDTSKATMNEECKNANKRFISACDDSHSHCLKIIGLVDGKPAGLRECTTNSWAVLLKGDDTCVPASSIPNFNYKHDDREVDLKNGTVCVCNSESCNGQGKVIPSISAAIIVTLIGIVVPAFY